MTRLMGYLICSIGLLVGLAGAHALSSLVTPPEPTAEELSGQPGASQERCYVERVGGRREVSCEEGDGR